MPGETPLSVASLRVILRGQKAVLRLRQDSSREQEKQPLNGPDGNWLDHPLLRMVRAVAGSQTLITRNIGRERSANFTVGFGQRIAGLPTNKVWDQDLVSYAGHFVDHFGLRPQTRRAGPALSLANAINASPHSRDEITPGHVSVRSGRARVVVMRKREGR